MKLNQQDLLALVAPEWREEFWNFVDTGHASPAFLEYLDRDEKCQSALDIVLTAQTDDLHRFGQALAAQSQSSKPGTARAAKRKRPLYWWPVVASIAVAAIVVAAVGFAASTISLSNQLDFARQQNDYLAANARVPPSIVASRKTWEARVKETTLQAAKDLDNKDAQIRALAANTLGELGPKAKAVDPTLIARLKDLVTDSDKNVRDAATQALWKIDPEEAAAGSPTKEDMYKDFVKQLLASEQPGKVLEDKAKALERAINSIAALQQEEERSVTMELGRLRSRNSADRIKAARALGEIGSVAKQAVPALMTRYKEEEKDEQVRAEVAQALKKIDLVAAKKAGVSLTEEEEARIRSADLMEVIARALKRAEQDTIAASLDGLKQDDPEVRIEAAEALARIGPSAEAAVPELRSRLSVEKTDAVRQKLQEALKKIDPVAAAKAGIL